MQVGKILMMRTKQEGPKARVRTVKVTAIERGRCREQYRRNHRRYSRTTIHKSLGAEQPDDIYRDEKFSRHVYSAFPRTEAINPQRIDASMQDNNLEHH